MSTLRAIRQIARSGDTERAWQLFEGAGLTQAGCDVDILTLKGRLLKDRAIKTMGAERSSFLVAAQSAYMEAASLLPATYPLINAATIALLDGRKDRAQSLAAETIAMLDSGAHEPETPYWLGATRAEALLLLGRNEEARATLADAIARAPAAWEDHASTLRHLRLILDALEQPAEWLDAHRPPPALHFSGIVLIGRDETAIRTAVEEALDQIRPGFAFGALAAGADIIIAEALVARGAQLHVVLPCTIPAFRRLSVLPFGDHWERRFDALIAVAETVETIGELDSVSEAGIIVADEVAMGLAIRQASILETTAAALRIGMPLAARPANTILDAAWSKQEFPMHVVPIQREDDLAGPPFTSHVREALIAIASGNDPAPLVAQGGEVVGSHAGHAVLSFTEPAAAARAALGFAGTLGRGAIAIDYHAFDPTEPPAERVELVTAAATAAMPGSIVLTRHMALALALETPELRPEALGEVATSIGDIALSSLDRRDQS